MLINDPSLFNNVYSLDQNPSPALTALSPQETPKSREMERDDLEVT